MTKDTTGKEIKPLTAENLALRPCQLSSYSLTCMSDFNCGQIQERSSV